MESQDVVLIIGAVFGGIASLIYSFRSVKKSDCCGNTCIQDTEHDVEANTNTKETMI